MISILAEGDGEELAGPALVRNILSYHLGENYILVHNRAGIARGKGALKKKFEGHLSLQFKRDGCEGVLVLVDSDDECAEELAKMLAARAREISPVPVAVVCPVREFESWFLCSAESICPCAPIPSDCEHHENPKDWLKTHLPDGSYRTTLDQADLAGKINLDLALPRSRSLNRMVNGIAQLVDSIHDGTPVFTP